MADVGGNNFVAVVFALGRKKDRDAKVDNLTTKKTVILMGTIASTSGDQREKNSIRSFSSSQENYLTRKAAGAPRVECLTLLQQMYLWLGPENMDAAWMAQELQAL